MGDIAGHGHPQDWLIQLPMTPCLHSVNFVNLLSLFELSYLQFISHFPVISLIPQLSFADGLD